MTATAETPKATTADLQALVGDKLQLAKKSEAKAVVDAVVESISELLKQKGHLQINDLGILRVRERPAREGINPKTGAKIAVGASKSVSFKASSSLKKVVA